MSAPKVADLLRVTISPNDKVRVYWKGSRVYVERRQQGTHEIVGHFNDPARAIDFANKFAEHERLVAESRTKRIGPTGGYVR